MITKTLEGGSTAIKASPISIIKAPSLYVFSTETSTKKARMNINKNPGSSLKNSVTPLSNSPILTT